MSGAAKGKLAVGALVLIALWGVALGALGGGPPERAKGARVQSAKAGSPSAIASTPPSATPASTSQAPQPRADTAQTRPVPAQDAGAEDPVERTPTPPASDPQGKSGGANTEVASDVDRGRAKHAAQQFVVYAYGYSGDDRAQYESYVNQAVVPSTFEASPGAEYVQKFAARISSGGTKSTVTPRGAGVLEISPESAEVQVSFDVEDTRGTHALAQRLTVVSLGPVWKVAAARELERRR